ncbi:MAG TPA: hypothetical protein VFP34_17630, partial [Microlunatus sp.]|nr:hypothetical protein [Microlunatus sp.]
MVAYAFYHNVENYSTSHAVAAALGNGYQGVRNVMAAGPIVVAGFSEILSPSAGPALAPAVTQLDPQLQMFAVVNIGIMLGREEYLAIAVSRPSPPIGAARPVAFNPLEIGRLVFHRTPHGGMTLVLDPWVHQGLGPPVLQPLPWPAGGAPGWANG